MPLCNLSLGPLSPSHTIQRQPLMCFVVCVSHSDSLQPHGLQHARLHFSWDSQARILEWVAIPFSRVSSRARDQTQVSCIAGRFFIA